MQGAEIFFMGEMLRGQGYCASKVRGALLISLLLLLQLLQFLLRYFRNGVCVCRG